MSKNAREWYYQRQFIYDMYELKPSDKLFSFDLKGKEKRNKILEIALYVYNNDIPLSTLPEDLVNDRLFGVGIERAKRLEYLEKIRSEEGKKK